MTLRPEPLDFIRFGNGWLVMDPNIKFTQEEWCDNKSAFLDCLVHRESKGSPTSTIYRKPTHTDHYLQFNSHYPLIHKLKVIRTLNYRADMIISEVAAIDEEKDHIQKSLNTCGYPNWAFQKPRKPKTYNRAIVCSLQQQLIPHRSPYCMLLVPQNGLKKSLKSYGISTSFKPINTLRGKLVHVKDKQAKDKQSNMV